MSERTIYEALIHGGLNHIGALAVMGNMMAESAMRANNVQDTYESIVGLNDTQYTDAVDSGRYSAHDFKTDSVGYGLCQWTLASRKMNLYNFAKSRGASIGDEDMQVQFCLNELRTLFAGLYDYLCYAGDLYEATKRVCYEFENPQFKNVSVRHKYAIEIGLRLENQGVAIIDDSENIGEKDANVAIVDYDYISDIEAHSKAILEIIKQLRN